MAKLSFKDMIFKFLKKDENLGAYGGVKQNPSKRFKVKFAMPNKPNNMAVAAYQFEKDAACSLALRVSRAAAIVPCAENEQNNADFQEADVVTILGEFQCPQLAHASKDLTIQAENGKFYCQVASQNQCIGGGGGGGGGVPPPDQ